jgi:S1-C subfamily serine protease
MTVRFSHLLIAALLLVPSVHAADGKKMCTADARDCEKAIRQLSSGRRYLGAEIVNLSPGIGIKAILDNGPAARSDLRVGDQIMAVNGRSTVEADIKDFKEILYSAKETGVLWIIVKRAGVLRKVDARLEPYSKAQIDKMVAQHLAQAHAMAAAPQQ